MPDQSGHSKEDAEDGGGNVCPAQEGLLAADPRDGRNDDGLCAGELLDGVVYISTASTKPTHICSDAICSLGHDFAVVPCPQLSEGRQCGDPHPHLEVLIFSKVRELCIGWELRLPVGWRKHIGRRRIAGSGDVVLSDTTPCDSLLGKVVRLVCSAICVSSIGSERTWCVHEDYRGVGVCRQLCRANAHH